MLGGAHAHPLARSEAKRAPCYPRAPFGPGGRPRRPLASAPMPLDSPLARSAADFARRAHDGQVRKCAAHPPYFVHLEAVATRLAAHGHDDDELLAAAYLHDVLEDQPAHAAELADRFPPAVVETVRLLTEQKLDARGQKRAKAERFADYVAGLRQGTPAARRAAVVSCADKIDNLEGLVAAQRGGDNLLGRLATRPGQHAPQLAILREIYRDVVGESLLAAFDSAVAALADTLARWLPGRAVCIAADAHLGQYDRAGAPAVLHPLRVMLAASTDEERMVAVLHDVVEDTPWTLAELADEGLPAPVLRALDCLTRREGEPYATYLERLLVDPLAARIKRLDLADNLARLAQLAEPERSRLEAKYRAAAARLGAEAPPTGAR